MSELFHLKKGDTLVKQIATAAYWIGILSAVVALIMRGLALVGVFTFSPHFVGKQYPVSYRTFLEGAALFFIMAIASGVTAWNKERRA
jgi:hypothetical protein